MTLVNILFKSFIDHIGMLFKMKRIFINLIVNHITVSPIMLVNNQRANNGYNILILACHVGGTMKYT